MNFKIVPSKPNMELCITEDNVICWVVGGDYTRGWNGSQWIRLDGTSAQFGMQGNMPSAPAGNPGPAPMGMPGGMPSAPAGNPGPAPMGMPGNMPSAPAGNPGQPPMSAPDSMPSAPMGMPPAFL